MQSKLERTAIHELVERARAGSNPYIILKMESGWVMAADTPLTPGHCVFLSDPVVFSINDLAEEMRMKYWRDCCRVGDALLTGFGSYRINYETLCNVAQSLHSHIVPRFETEPEDKRRERAAVAYPNARKVEAAQVSEFIAKIKALINR